MPTGFGLRPGRESAGRATEPYRLRASPRLYRDRPVCSREPWRKKDDQNLNLTHL